MLSGRFKEAAALADGDFRGMTPRYQGDAYQANLALVDEIETIAAKYNCQSAQMALAWVLGRGEHTMTIPGTSKLENLKTNLGGYDVVLAEDDLQSLDRLADRVMGDRYDQRGMSIING